MRIQFNHSFENVISIENLAEAWKEFIRGKRKKTDVQEFSRHLMDHIFSLHNDLSHHTYRHGGYQAFNISDPKPRNIHKASVRDRLLHRAIYRILYPFFDRTFIADSFSCRVGKGTHAALNRFQVFGYRVSRNRTRTAWVLKCDVRKFFGNIDHNVLREILKMYISDPWIIRLLDEVIDSFHAGRMGVGLPLGNLTSQLFVNVYMNEFDQLVKHRLRAEYYIRYADDFVLMSENRAWLQDQLSLIRSFLERRLKLCIPTEKIRIQTLASGVDFLGWVHFPEHRVLRAATKRRMMRRIREHPASATLVSYQGLLSHGNTDTIRRQLVARYLLA